MSDILTRVEAICTLSAGESLSSLYRRIYFERWDDERNDSVVVAERFQLLESSVPWEIRLGGKLYRQGQCSGPGMVWVTFDHIEG